MQRLLALLLLTLLPALAGAQVTTPHPRLILDSTLLTSLRARATANAAPWSTLKTYCDQFINGDVEYPDGTAYPDRPDGIGQGYQGDGYWAPFMSEALCYQTLKGIDADAAAPYGAKAVEILLAVSQPFPGEHGEDPCTDDGYVIRFYGVIMGIGYDWLYELLTPAQRQQVYTTANSMITSWETNTCSRFAYEHPQGNYFAGYFHAKAAVALATYGDNPSAPAQWTDWQNTQFRTAASNAPHIGVLPYYQQHLAGGGWPEGFANYGPLATLNMILPIWEVKTATGMDLVNAASPFTYPIDMGEYAMHFTWPSRDYFDDRDDNHANGNDSLPAPGTANTHLFVHLLGAARYFNAAHANVLQQYADEVDAATDGYDLDAWEDFLFRDPAGATAALATLPRAYFAAGMNAVAARSDWTTGASWMSFRAGPYVNNPGASHELFDQGSLALVRGKTPLLVNASGWIVHEPFGNDDESRLMADNFGGFSATNPYTGNRALNNVFYVRHVAGAALAESFGQYAATTEDNAVRTHVSHFEDGGSYVLALGEHIEDMYRSFANDAPAVAGWAREVIYLRPNRVVVYDRTQAGATGNDQYLAFHFAASPVAANAPAGTSRFDISVGATFAGAMSIVLPVNAAATSQAMYPAKPTGKVWEAQIRPADTAASQRWLTVFDTSASSSAVAQASAATVDSGNAVGVFLADASANSVVLANAGAAGTAVTSAILYRTPAVVTHHLLTELAPATGYAVSVTVAGGEHHLSVSVGGSYMTSANGVLAFDVAANGSVNGAAVDGVCGADNGLTLALPPVNLCSTGAPSAVQGDGPWNWTCAGSNGGATASCSAQLADESLAPTSTMLGLSPSPATVGQGVLATVRVIDMPTFAAGGAAPAAIGGNVTIAGGGKACVATLTDGNGSCTLRFDVAGPVTISATYPGDAAHSASSDTQAIVVQAAAGGGNGSGVLPAPALGRLGLLLLLFCLSTTSVMAHRRPPRR